jgi:hypothetical protein
MRRLRDVVPDVHIFTRSTIGSVTLPTGAPATDVFGDTKKLRSQDSFRRLRPWR